jgi:excisionase family DNA binding protein
MNKEQAAKRLRVSVRTLQRYMSANRIAFTMRPTKTGEEAVFDKSEVDRFKAELKEKRRVATVAPAVSPDTPTSEAVSPSEPNEQTALEVFQSAPPAFFEAAPDLFWKRLADGLAARRRPAPTKTVPDLAHQLLLSLPEAAALSGVPLSKLRADAHSGALKTVRSVGRGLGKVRSKELERYVSKLK